MTKNKPKKINYIEINKIYKNQTVVWRIFVSHTFFKLTLVVLVDLYPLYKIKVYIVVDLYPLYKISIYTSANIFKYNLITVQ
jgi:hypothetical protein